MECKKNKIRTNTFVDQREDKNQELGRADKNLNTEGPKLDVI